MMQYFYAYHGSSNKADFEPSGGYGVSSESKQKKVNVGDLVFVIQRVKKSAPFELCGLYEVTGHGFSASSKNRYRMRLADTRRNPTRININEDHVSHELPELTSNQTWSNFKRHFCRQGGSFQSPLQPAVVRVLTDILRDSMVTKNQEPLEIKAVDREFQEEVRKSRQSTPEERMLRLAKADKIPRTRLVLTAAFVRNPDVVAEALHLAGDFCGNCNKEGPFCRRSDGSKYLEVHHKVPLAQGGEDTLENAIALCPNCHRKMHYGV